MCTYMSHGTCTCQRTTYGNLSTIWVPGIELRSLGLVANAFIYRATPAALNFT